MTEYDISHLLKANDQPTNHEPTTMTDTNTTTTTATTTNDKQKTAERKRVTLEAIAKECSDAFSSEHADVRAIAKGLASGRELDLTILTGGLCNYSYKIYFREDDHEEPGKDVELFAKMTFGAPVSFSAVPCPLNRTNNEYEMMERYARVSPFPGSTATPYFCIDADDGFGEENTKILVTQFAPAGLEEQAGHLFIDGGPFDNYEAFASKLARGLAALHNMEVTDPNFNEGMKPFFMELAEIMPSLFDGYLGLGGDDDNDEQLQTEDKRTVEEEEVVGVVSKLARSIGKEKLDKITEGYRECLQRSDCYVHGDCHAFNILVADTSNNTTAAAATATAGGDFSLIDWEFTHCGPIGKDLGWFHAFPIACLLAHASRGDIVSSESLLEFLDALWGEYSLALNTNTSNAPSLASVYRQVLGFAGVMLKSYGALGFHMEYLPITIEEDNRSDNDTTRDDVEARVRESLGVLGLKTLAWGFGGDDDDTATVEDMKDRFFGAIRDEMHRLAPPPQPSTSSSSKRRSSLLRETGRRVSDAHTLYLHTLATAEEEAPMSASGNGASSASRRSIAARRESILKVEKLMADTDYDC